MKHLVKLLLIFILLPFISTAQTNYKPGYVVTLTGDTLHGFIDYKEWENSPAKINFKANLQSNEAKNFSPGNSAAFGINGFEYYEQYKLSVSLSRVDPERMSTGVDTSTTTATVFLKVVVKGKNVNLYEYNDDIKLRFYIKDRSSGKPDELILRTYLDPDNSTRIVTQTRYKNQLQQLASKYQVSNEKLTKIIEGSNYTEKDIIDIVSKINEAENRLNNIRKIAPVRFFLGAGINRSSLKYSGNTYLALNANSKAGYGPKLAIGIDAFSNPNVGRLILRAELSLATTGLQVNSNTSPYASQSFSQFVIALTPQLIYNFYNTESLKIYTGAGFAINLPKYTNDHYDYDPDPYSGTRSVIKNYPNLASTYVSFSGTLGFVLSKKYEVYASYIPSAVVTDHYELFSGAITSLQLGFNYLFGSR